MFGMALAMLLAAANPATEVDCNTQWAELGAKNQDFYIKHEAIEIDGEKFEKFGLPRVLWAGEFKYVGDYQGVPIAVGTLEPDESVVYLMLGSGKCEFQPYQMV